MDNSIFLVDKPKGWTSFDVVNKLRGGLQIKKMGHAGTLDPLASGLLIMASGKKTVELERYQNLDKEYEGVIGLGRTTASYDLETPYDSFQQTGHLSDGVRLKEEVKRMMGTIQQVPPPYSAVKVQGKRAYKLARKQMCPKLEPRTIQIKEFRIVDHNIPEIQFYIRCSKGTYIRSVAHDLGRALGVGGHLRSLRRTAIGEFSVRDARTIDEIISSSR